MSGIPVLGKYRDQGGPGSNERFQGQHSAGRVKAFTVATQGFTPVHTVGSFSTDRCVFGATPINIRWSTGSYVYTAAGGVGSFQIGETVTAPGGFSGTLRSKGGATTPLTIEWTTSAPTADVLVTGGTSGATATIDVDTQTLPVEWGIVNSSTAGWRHERLPFPCTPCISILGYGDFGTGRRIKLRVKGIGQFGEVVEETSPLINLVNVNAGFDFTFCRFWMSRVFATVTSVEYQTYGNTPFDTAAPASTPQGVSIYCGQFFTWDQSLATSISDTTAVISFYTAYYFSYNQGIGTQIRLAGEFGAVGRRYPEVVSCNVRLPVLTIYDCNAGGAGTFLYGEVVRNAGSTKFGRIRKVINSPGATPTLWVESEIAPFQPFNVGEIFTGVTSTATGTIIAVTPPSGAGPACTAQLQPAGDVIGSNIAGFFMGFTSEAQWGALATDTLTTIKVGQWEGDTHKICLSCLTDATHLINNPALPPSSPDGRVNTWDGAKLDMYTPADPILSVGTMDNPKPVIYDFVFRTKAGAKTPKMTVSTGGVS